MNTGGEWIALGSLVVSILALAASVLIWQRQLEGEERRRKIEAEQEKMQQSLSALRGSKEQVAIQAMYYADHQFPEDGTQRLEVVRSLILAAVF